MSAAATDPAPFSLFSRYPALRARVPRVVLGELPTAVECADAFSRELDLAALFVKRDDRSAADYGGNKVRKLELVLADAQRRGASEVLTFGYAGSNHATATAVMAERVGMRSISMLLPQLAAPYVRSNLLRSLAAGAEIHYYANTAALVAGTGYVMARRRLATGRAPYVIAAGGSSPLGTVGFVAAAFELADQVAAGELPEPDVVYVAGGTGGTAAGLQLGFRAAGMDTSVRVVRVVNSSLINEARCARLLRKTNALLTAADPTFPQVDWDPADVDMCSDFYGGEYALETAAGREAVERAHELEGWMLDRTYTGKALAALLADARSGRLRGRTVLFWHTYSSRDVAETIAEVDYRELPRGLHRYFEGDSSNVSTVGAATGA